MVLTVELEQEDAGRWIGEVLELPGVMAYGPSSQEHGEAGPELRDISFKAA